MTPDAQISDGLSITLSHASPDDAWVAVAVVITKADHRHRITFTQERPMEEVFCSEMTSLLRPILARFGANNEVYSNPDTEIRLPGLTMAQLRVIFSKHDDGHDRVLVRFATFAGNPHRALLAEDGFAYPLEALTTQVYRDALDWVLIPAVNIASVDEISGFGVENNVDVDSALAKLRASKEQLLFQVELVKRELGRLEANTYSRTPRCPMLMAAEPPQEEFRTMRVIRDMD
jgi:hypothetical protein